jgi:indole-3-glycerol phosphate synthase
MFTQKSGFSKSGSSKSSSPGNPQWIPSVTGRAEQPARSRIIYKSFMPSLHEILSVTRQKVADSRSHTDLRDLERRAGLHTPRGFRNAIASASQSVPAIIAELKKASPSRGLIRGEFDPAVLAPELEIAGAVALSVLTDERFFQGSLNNLLAASASSKLPCLRKDFIIDEFQILEARANHADAVLLIVSALSQQRLAALLARAAELELDVLCEVHDEAELGRVLDAGCELIGVNSRDLRTFNVDLATVFRVIESVPPGVIAVAESGIESGADIARLQSAGYNGFLVGEALMKAPRPGDALRGLLREAAMAVSAAN